MNSLVKKIWFPFLLAFAGAAMLQAPPAEAQQLCVPFSVFGQVTDGVNPVDGANVTLTNTTSQAQLQTVTAQGGFYLFETANMSPCLSAGENLTVQASLNNLSGSQSFVFSGGALQEINITLGGAPANDTTPPVITINGANPVTVALNTAYTDAGATAADNVDGDITGSITVTGLPINTALAGNYTVTYSVSDAAGNPASADRPVIVQTDNPTPPVLTSIVISPAAPAPVDIGGTVQFTAAALDQNGAPIAAAIIWTSSSSAVGLIDPSTGLFTAAGTGTTVVTASSGGVSDTVDITVKAPANPPVTPPGNPPAGGTLNPATNTPDTTDRPEIEGINRKGATITWTTSSPTPTKILVADKRTYLSGKQLKKKKKKARTVAISAATTNHSVQLTTLKRNKKCYFRIVTVNPDGSETMSNIFVFRTKK